MGQDWLAYERNWWRQGFAAVCGLDEAGRGPLAGPVVAAAVVLPRDVVIAGVDDSKKLTEKRREALFDEICASAAAYAVAEADVEEIERLNILGASLLAMRRACAALLPAAQAALVDGNRDPALGIPTRTVVGGDGKCACVAAASILAKVTRDRQMRALDAAYPQYGFARHKGYPTRAHYEAILRYGLCPAHRPSFLRNLAQKRARFEAAAGADGGVR